MKKLLIHIFLCLLSVHVTAKEESSIMDSTKIATILSEIRLVNDNIKIEQKLSQAREVALNSKTEWILPWFIIEEANLYTKLSHNKKQINKLLDSAERCIYNQHIFDKQAINLLVRIANMHKIQKNIASAIKLQNTILLLKPDLATSIAIYGNLGLIYSHIHDYTNSLKHYQKAIQLIEQNVDHSRDTDDSMTISALEMTVGEIYLEINQYDKALMHFRNTEKYFNKSIEAMLSNELQIRKCKAYLGMKSYDIALPQLLDLYASFKDDEDNKLIVNTLLVATYIKLDSYKLVDDYLHKALALQHLPIYPELKSKLLHYNGQLAAHNHQYTAAIQYYQEAIKACASNHELTDALDAWEALYQLYDQQHETAKSYDAYKQYIAVKEQINQLNKTNEILRIELLSDFNKKQLGDSLLQANAYNLKIQKQQAFTYSGFIGLILVIVLTFFIYRNYNTQKKYNAILNKEKLQHLADIDAQKTVLTDIAYVQSHEIRGPISTIMGLVQIFNFDKPEDPMNKELLEGIYEVTQRLDQKVKEVVQKENALHTELNKRNNEEG